MPFFTIKSPRFTLPQPMPLEQVEVACRKLTVEALLNLKGRIFNFFKVEDVRRERAKTAIAGIDVRLAALEKEINANKESIAQAIRSNNEIKENLPGNGAERWLALQALAQIPDTKYELEDEVRELQRTKEQFLTSIVWINKEFSACAAELQVIEQVMEEKRLKEMETPRADNVMRM